MKLWVALTLFLFVTSVVAAAEVRIVQVNPIKEQLGLTTEQFDKFLVAYRDFEKKRKSAIRRAQLKARGSDDAMRRVKRADKKVNASFDKKVATLLEEKQFALYLATRDLVVNRLSDRRAGFSDASIPNPGGLLAAPGVYGGNN